MISLSSQGEQAPKLCIVCFILDFYSYACRPPPPCFRTKCLLSCALLYSLFHSVLYVVHECPTSAAGVQRPSTCLSPSRSATVHYVPTQSLS